jgi:hypothetical protein
MSLAISWPLYYVSTDARTILCFMLKVFVFWLLLVLFALARCILSIYIYILVHFHPFCWFRTTGPMTGFFDDRIAFDHT